MIEPEGPHGGEMILYRTPTGAVRVEVLHEDETLWLSQRQMADLFGVDVRTVSEHLANIFGDKELPEEAVIRKFRTTASDGKSYLVNHYNLDAIISVGYRVNSTEATQFRIWATQTLREFVVKGFAMDDERLKELGGGRYWRELLDRIRDIRSSEKVLYRQVLDLYATSLDYDPNSEETATFFKMIQNKLHYAAHGQTAAEVVATRADAGKPFMGLLSFSGSQPTKAEALVAKNYLDESELKRLNTLVSAYFDAAEFRAQNRQTTRMTDWLAHLDRLIVAMEAKTLDSGGSVSRQQAIDTVGAEYARYRTVIDAKPSEVEGQYLETVKRAQRNIEGKGQH